MPQNPLKFDDFMLIKAYFFQKNSLEKLLLDAPKAILRNDGTIKHSEECMCESSLLTEGIACICNIDDEACLDN